MIKKGSKQSKVSRIDRSKALAAQADEAIKERIRTAPAYIYTSLSGSGAAPAVEGSDCTWHQDLCTMTCMIVANTTAGTEQRS